MRNNKTKCFSKHDSEYENAHYTSTEKISYKRYSLAVVGEDQNGSLKHVQPAQEIHVTTIDSLVYVSEEYAKWMPKMNEDIGDLIEKLVF